MSIECTDPEYYVALSDDLVISRGTEFCHECNRLIPAGEAHYRVFEYNIDDCGDEVHKAQHTVCEVCGDLALSWMKLGYCWEYGALRNDIAELHEL